MTFSPEQLQQLQAPLDKRHVASRNQAGRSLSYVESWYCISEANRIFGHDGWSSETLDCKCATEAPRKIGQPPRQREGYGVTYTARVRVTVYAGERAIIREGVGAGHGIDVDLGQAHESAIKEAESDAQKRCLRQFGWTFGLALYDKKQEHVSDGLDEDRAHVEHIVNTPAKQEPPAPSRPSQPVAPSLPVIPTVQPPQAVVRDAEGKLTSGEVRKAAAKQDDWRARDRNSTSQAAAAKLMRGPISAKDVLPLSVIEADIEELGSIRSKHRLHAWDRLVKTNGKLLTKADYDAVMERRKEVEQAIDRSLTGADTDGVLPDAGAAA
jgi:hypothetical protein